MARGGRKLAELLEKLDLIVEVRDARAPFSTSTFRARSETTDWPHLFLILDGVSLPMNTSLGGIGGLEGVTVVRTMTSWGPMTSRATLRMILHPGARPGDCGRMELLLLDHDRDRKSVV